MTDCRYALFEGPWLKWQPPAASKPSWRIDAARGWSSEVTSCGRSDLSMKVGAKRWMMGDGWGTVPRAPPFSALDPRPKATGDGGASIYSAASLVSGAKMP
jgi:hypothetical protein